MTWRSVRLNLRIYLRPRKAGIAILGVVFGLLLSYRFWFSNVALFADYFYEPIVIAGWELISAAIPLVWAVGGGSQMRTWDRVAGTHVYRWTVFYNLVGFILITSTPLLIYFVLKILPVSLVPEAESYGVDVHTSFSEAVPVSYAGAAIISGWLALSLVTLLLARLSAPLAVIGSTMLWISIRLAASVPVLKPFAPVVAGSELQLTNFIAAGLLLLISAKFLRNT